jgi:hypothetical protein
MGGKFFGEIPASAMTARGLLAAAGDQVFAGLAASGAFIVKQWHKDHPQTAGAEPFPPFSC